MSKITVYAKDYCPFCAAAKSLLNAKGVDFEWIEITGDQQRRDEMLARSEGRSTVPQIFIGDQHIGGYDDLNALNKSGGLDSLLQQ